MSVDTKIYLPSYVAVNDIAKTRAVLAGGMVSIKEIGDTKFSVRVVKVDGWVYKRYLLCTVHCP